MFCESYYVLTKLFIVKHSLKILSYNQNISTFVVLYTCTVILKTWYTIIHDRDKVHSYSKDKVYLLCFIHI